MRTCRRFHIEDVERGDRLHLSDREGPSEFDITVRSRYRTNNFGWVIESEEKIGPDEDGLFYLNDDWDIRLSATNEEAV